MMTAESSEAKFTLSLSGDGVNVEREIDRGAALQILNIALGNGEDVPVAKGSAGGGGSVVGEMAGKPRLSLREYLDQVEATRKPDQIVAIGQFICEHEGAKDFGRDDIKSRFSLAREPLPGNFARDFSWTLRNGWIAQVHGESDRYYVTQKGSQAVESRFSPEVRKATASKKGQGRRRRVESAADET